MRLAWRLALRDLRGGRRGLLIVVLCLAVGVAAIAGVGSLRAAINQGLAQDGRAILGGDLAISTGSGALPPALSDWFLARHGRLSETVRTRSILVAPSGRRLLAAVEAVSPTWPLLGRVTTAPAGGFSELLASGALPGLLLDPTAADTLGLKPGDRVTLGGVPLRYLGKIVDAPDRISDSQLFGVKALVPLDTLRNSSLLASGSLATYALQVALPAGLAPERVTADLAKTFPVAAWRVRGVGEAAPDITRFVDQAALFMILLGLAALLVGGIGVANGVEAWLAARARSIATLRCLGASAQLMSAVLGFELALLGLPGVLLGLVVGGLAPLLVLPLLRNQLPVPANLALYSLPLALAAAFGLLVALVFAMPPLRRASAISGAALFRAAVLPQRLPWTLQFALAEGFCLALLVGLAAVSVPRPVIALGFCAGTAATLLLLRGVAWLLMRALARLPRPRSAALAFGLRRLHGPASSLPLMLLSLGAGLTVLVAVAEIRANLVAEFTGALPSRAPSFYFIDVQPADLPKFETVARAAGAYDLAALPSLRARILAVRGVPVAQFHAPSGTDWPLRSDVGLSFAAAPPAGTRLVAGHWWAADYTGPPLVSFDARVARSWGIGVGDLLPVSVLGRSFDLRIANLRDIHWQSLQLNFFFVATPDPFAGAPHTMIATLRTPPGQEGRVLAAVTDALPGVTGIDVGAVLRGLAGLLGQIGTAVSLVGLVALLAGGLVLVSAIAVEREARIAESVILKTLGARRAQIRLAWLTEFAVAGGAAGIAAAVLGDLAAMVTIREVFHTEWHFLPGIMVMTIVISIVTMVMLGFLATERVLRLPAAPRLRAENG
jgi:putative ABC transport system permease protein